MQIGTRRSGSSCPHTRGMAKCRGEAAPCPTVGLLLGLLLLSISAQGASAWQRKGRSNAIATLNATLVPTACRVPHRRKTVDVGGYLGWALGMYGKWKQPKIYVGDRLRFTWPAPLGGDDNSETSSLTHPLSTRLLEHNVYRMPSRRAFNRCVFSTRNRLSERNYTTPRFTQPGTYYYSCEEDRHCALGQKVAVVVQAAPLTDPCPAKPPPPGPSGTIRIGNHPTYWTLDLSAWKQPAVKSGNTLLFLWDRNTAAPPHDVWLMLNKVAYDSCDFSRATRLTPTTDTGSFRYSVKQRAGATIYFACQFTFHCAASMKVAIKVS